MKIDCLKSTKDLVDSLITFPSNLVIVIFNWLCTEIYIIIIITLQLYKLTHKKRIYAGIADSPHIVIVDQLHDPPPLSRVVGNLGVLHPFVAHIPSSIVHDVKSCVEIGPGAQATDLDFYKTV